MAILVRNITLRLEESEAALSARAAKHLRVPMDAIRAYAIVSRAVDARRGNPQFVYQIELALQDGPKAEERAMRRARPGSVQKIEPIPAADPTPGSEPLRHRPAIIGFGPAGMFAALRLAQYGYAPIVLERGRDVRRRHRDVMQRYYRERDFDPSSNLLFGEGGAGTYSDGKLYTRISDHQCRCVLETLYQHGADPDILIDTRPHIGSDKLPTICTRIRKRIESLGGEIQFESTVTDVRIDDGRLAALQVPREGTGGSHWMNVGPTNLAAGHSARDTIRMLADRGVTIESKPFQIGVRIEHPQGLIDRKQYGQACGHARLGPAEYHLVARKASALGGDVFSFCMCPGGEILPTNEAPELIATNGASRAHRSGRFANSGLVITMDPQAMNIGPLEALAFQKQWERLAFAATGHSYRVPAQRAADFLAGRRSDGQLETSFPLGGAWTEIGNVVPPEVTRSLARALPMLEKQIPGFAGPEAIITAPETRASAPIRITRDRHSRMSISVQDLYPVGEGAGYAGGILSAAVDGLHTADAIIQRFARP